MKQTVFLFLLIGALLPLVGAETPAKPSESEAEATVPSKREPPRRRGHRNGYWIWRAFSQMTEAERRSMSELQRSDPEKFLKEMRKKGEALFRQEQARRAEIRSLVERHKSADAKQQAAIKQRLTDMERQEFRRRVNELSHQIRATKARIAHMEADLKKRRAHAGEIIAVRVEAMLKGELFERPPRRRGGGPVPPPPPPPEK